MVILFPIEIPRRPFSTKPVKFNSATFSRFVRLPKIDFLDYKLEPYRKLYHSYPPIQWFCIQISNQLHFSRSLNGILYKVLSKQKYVEVLKFPLKLLNRGMLKIQRVFVSIWIWYTVDTWKSTFHWIFQWLQLMKMEKIAHFNNSYLRERRSENSFSL